MLIEHYIKVSITRSTLSIRNKGYFLSLTRIGYFKNDATRQVFKGCQLGLGTAPSTVLRLRYSRLGTSLDLNISQIW
jgi:hypothetical protein